MYEYVFELLYTPKSRASLHMHTHTYVMRDSLNVKARMNEMHVWALSTHPMRVKNVSVSLFTGQAGSITTRFRRRSLNRSRASWLSALLPVLSSREITSARVHARTRHAVALERA